MSKPYKDFEPKWFLDKPAAKSYRSIFKWGDPTFNKVPKENLYKMIKDVFGMTDDDFRQYSAPLGQEEVAFDVPVTLTTGQIATLAGIVGANNLSTDSYDRLSVAYGKTMFDLLRLRQKIVENVPDVVLYPQSKAQIEAIVAFCSAEKVPLYVYGGGSSVTRGVECMKGGISLDLRRHFNKVIDFNETDQTITVEAGMSGPKLEETLNNAAALFGAKRAYTCGHFPQSFEYSSVGGWTVTRGAGQNSTYYGKIEDIVIGQQYATPTGNVTVEPFPARATGPDINHIMMGSEGTFGVLTHVTLRIFRFMPQNRRRFSYIFKDWHTAMAAAAEIMQCECGRPSVFRLSDAEETDCMMRLYGVDESALSGVLSKLGYKSHQRCLFLGFTDGEKGFSDNIRRVVGRVCRKYGAMSLTGAVTKAWEKGRFNDPYMRDTMQDFGIMTDTLECTVRWSQMESVHQLVREYCHSRPNTICMTHMSHVYPQGANLYFIFIAKMNTLEEFVAYWSGILDHIQKSGATMSHHHGIGKFFAPWLEGQIGTRQMEIFKALKTHFDPDNLMNPGGTLGLDLEDREKKFLRIQ
jgi:alkyldihydroxyacetonephosphate synthase